MNKIVSTIYEFPLDVIKALLMYVAGFLTNEAIDVVMAKRKKKTLRRKTQVAFKAINVAEKRFPGKDRGEDKLEFAVDYLIEHSKVKKHEEAQSFILQCFPLTTYSKE